jgi:serine/threonine-protein kinase RsbW
MLMQADRTSLAAGRPAEVQPAFTLRVLARNRSIRDSLAEVRLRLSKHALSEEELATIEVVLAEVMNNIAEHAYAWRRDGEMILFLRLAPDGLSISVSDEGIAMPDMQIPFGGSVDPAAPLSEMPEGGFGWLIIRQLARDVSYTRQDGVNHLSFRIDVGRTPGI